jgi:hypothetical protein
MLDSKKTKKSKPRNRALYAFIPPGQSSIGFQGGKTRDTGRMASARAKPTGVKRRNVGDEFPLARE